MAADAKAPAAASTRAQSPVDDTPAPPQVSQCLTAPLIARALRIHQWSKNLLVIVPAALAGQLDRVTLLHVLVGFVALSLTASGLYVVNDMIDVDKDRAHPLKRRRPLASGAITSNTATALAATAIALGLSLAALLGAQAFLVVVGYMAASLAYTLAIKKLLLADVLMLAVLYSFRLFAGGVFAGVVVTDWLIVFAVFFFLGLSLMKRLVDIQARAPAAPSASSSSSELYRTEDGTLLQMLGIAASMTSFAILALYISSERGRALYPHHEILWGVWLVVFYCVSRLWFCAVRGEVRDDPVTFVLRATYCHISVALCLALLLLARLH
jgi:4-hydroxybenzoate polyprenyltransferase